jgi:hypothetical protein
MCHRPSSRVRTRSSSKPPNVACGTTEKRRRTSLMSVVWNIPFARTETYWSRPNSDIGGQICCDAQIGYGPRFSEFLRQWARLAAKILRGAKRADVPIEQPTHFELVINLQTARAIGLEVPAWGSYCAPTR